MVETGQLQTHHHETVAVVATSIVVVVACAYIADIADMQSFADDADMPSFGDVASALEKVAAAVVVCTRKGHARHIGSCHHGTMTLAGHAVGAVVNEAVCTVDGALAVKLLGALPSMEPALAST